MSIYRERGKRKGKLKGKEEDFGSHGFEEKTRCLGAGGFLDFVKKAFTLFSSFNCLFINVTCDFKD